MSDTECALCKKEKPQVITITLCAACASGKATTTIPTNEQPTRCNKCGETQGPFQQITLCARCIFDLAGVANNATAEEEQIAARDQAVQPETTDPSVYSNEGCDNPITKDTPENTLGLCSSCLIEASRNYGSS